MTQNEDYENTQLYKIRHSLAHVMAQAVLEMFPKGKAAIGPPIENGFYYDFDLPRALTEEDLTSIQKRMRNIVKQRHKFAFRELSANEAKQLFADQPYKIELIEGLEAGGLDDNGEPLPESKKPVITTYKHDTFEDLCKGPHVEDLGKINPKSFKLLSVAGAYWRGDEKRAQLQRIYGTAWESSQDLQDYLHKLEEAKKRDHRKLGKALDLFSSDSDEIGGGLILWHPKGALMRHLIEDFYRKEHLKNGYDLVSTPHIGRGKLWQTSGHLDFYKEGMYSSMKIDEQDYYLKPMNCPFHIMIYNNRKRSYRELPLRYSEWGTVYRYERSGTLHGLLRVRGFTQDDAHHFIRPDQLDEEIDFTLKFSVYILKSFGFENIEAYLSTQPPEKSVGAAADWRKAESALQASLDRSGLTYEMDEGGGAFYGPKIDLKIRDAIGRAWQLSTIQVDFNLPERFDMTFIGQDGKEHRPFMLHRALLGSLERFFGILIEHYAGAFPVWLAPVQAVLIPIADRHIEYSNNVSDRLKEAGIRTEVDDGGDRMGNKIRKAQGQKIPYMLVVGDKEMEAEEVALRLRNGEDLGPKPVAEFIEIAAQAVAAKNV